MTSTSRLVVLVLASAARVATAEAQTNERAYEAIEFRLVTPGARAVGMGKTFVGIADDATAAASNPAGLSNLLVPEASLEWSYADIAHARMVGLNPLKTETFRQAVAFPSFMSYVTPLPDKRGLRDVTVALFYNSLQRFKDVFAVPNFDRDRKEIPQGGYDGHMDITASAYGASASVLLSRSISLGGSVTLQRLAPTIESNTRIDGEFRSGSVTEGSYSEIGWQIGGLAKPARWMTLGMAYNRGTTFRTWTTIHGKFTSDAGLTRDVSVFLPNPTQPTDYRIPDRITFGVSVRPVASLAVLADVSSVRYSQRITDNFLIVDFLAQPRTGIARDLYYMPDVTELHVGGEYRFTNRGRVGAIRAGMFTDPDHQMRFDIARAVRDGHDNGVTRSQEVQFNSFSPGAVGFTGGAGIVLGNRYQIDAAFSWTRNAAPSVAAPWWTRELVISSVVRFPH